MRTSIRLLSLAAAAALFGIGPAGAQSTGTTLNTGSNPSGGVTSGPAVGSPATLGTGGTTPSTPHQTDTIRNNGGAAIKHAKQGQHGGTRASVKPGRSDAGAGVHEGRQ